MKLPKSRRSALRELDRVVAKATKSIDVSSDISKESFEHVLERIMMEVVRNRRIDLDQVVSATSEVVEEIVSEYKQMGDELKGEETLIALIYLKYHQVLGLDTSMFE